LLVKGSLVDRRYPLLASLGLLLASTFAVFALLKAASGSQMAAYLKNPYVGASDIARLNRELGAGQPFFVQYFAWLFRVLHGDLGWSPSNSEPVSQAIVERLPATIELAFLGFMAALVLGALVGFVRARARAPMLRDVLAVPQLVCRAIPVIIFAMFLQLLLILTVSLPPAGMSSVEGFDLGDRLRHLIVPVFTLAVPFGAWSSLIFYDFFRASDNPLRIPVRSFVGPVAMTAAFVGPALLSASLLIEPMFAWPGVARLLSNGLSQLDFGLVAGLLLTYSVGVVLIKVCAEFALDIGDRGLPRQTGSSRTPANRRKGFSAIGVIACVVLLSAAFGAVTANLIAPIGPYYIDQVHWQGYPLAPGVAGHALGTDESGRDLLARVLFALRTSLGIAAFAALIATAIGAVVARATKAVPWFDDRGALSVTGIRPFAAFPFILATVAVLVAKFHTVGVLSPLVMALIIAVVSWPAIVPAFRALTPATLGGVVDLTACALVLEVTLSIFGFGVQAPAPSLGNMFMNMQSNMTVAPWVVIAPTVVVIVTLFALYAVADELRDGRTAR
jgi:peptide/nickel transport system permease protein